MLILFNGRVGARQYRLLIYLVDGKLYSFRPYVGTYLFNGVMLYEY